MAKKKKRTLKKKHAPKKHSSKKHSRKKKLKRSYSPKPKRARTGPIMLLDVVSPSPDPPTLSPKP